MYRIGGHPSTIPNPILPRVVFCCLPVKRRVQCGQSSELLLRRLHLLFVVDHRVLGSDHLRERHTFPYHLRQLFRYLVLGRSPTGEVGRLCEATNKKNFALCRERTTIFFYLGDLDDADNDESDMILVFRYLTPYHSLCFHFITKPMEVGGIIGFQVQIRKINFT